MQKSIRGHMLPESIEDAKELAATRTALFRTCTSCGIQLHHPDAASTTLGWRETQISGVCEPCFDRMFEDLGD